jgi:hypothetical protein
MIVHHDLGRAPCVRPVIVWAEALFAEQRDIIAGVLLGPQRGQLGPLPSLAPDVAFAPIAVVRRPQFWSRGSIDRDSRFSVPPDLM